MKPYIIRRPILGLSEVVDRETGERAGWLERWPGSWRGHDIDGDEVVACATREAAARWVWRLWARAARGGGRRCPMT